MQQRNQQPVPPEDFTTLRGRRDIRLRERHRLLVRNLGYGLGESLGLRKGDDRERAIPGPERVRLRSAARPHGQRRGRRDRVRRTTAAVKGFGEMNGFDCSDFSASRAGLTSGRNVHLSAAPVIIIICNQRSCIC